MFKPLLTVLCLFGLAFAADIPSKYDNRAPNLQDATQHPTVQFTVTQIGHDDKGAFVLLKPAQSIYVAAQPSSTGPTVVPNRGETVTCVVGAQELGTIQGSTSKSMAIVLNCGKDSQFVLFDVLFTSKK